jgi:hypothetical protein
VGIAWRVQYLSAVGHAKETLAGVLQLEVLIRELCAVDRLAASPVALGKITRSRLAIARRLQGGSLTLLGS